jgi:hypothetical protein
MEILLNIERNPFPSKLKTNDGQFGGAFPQGQALVSLGYFRRDSSRALTLRDSSQAFFAGREGCALQTEARTLSADKLLEDDAKPLHCGKGLAG